MTDKYLTSSFGNNPLWISQTDKATLKLILEQLNFVDIKEVPDTNQAIAFREMENVKSVMANLINQNTSSSRYTLRSFGSNEILDYINNNIRKPVLNVYRCKTFSIKSSMYHDYLHSILIALTLYWPLNLRSNINNNLHNGSGPSVKCVISRNPIDPRNQVILSTGHIVDRRHYLEKYPIENFQITLPHPISQQPIFTQDFEYNFKKKGVPFKLKPNLVETIRNHYPEYGFNLKSFFKLSLAPSVLLAMITGCISILLLPQVLLPVAVVIITLSTIVGAALGIFIGMYKNIQYDNKAIAELSDILDTTLSDWQKKVTASTKCVNTFIDKIVSTRNNIHQVVNDYLRNLSISSSIILNTLLGRRQTHTSSLVNIANSSSRLHSETNPAQHKFSYVSHIDFTLSIVDHENPEDSLSVETISMEVPSFRNQRG